MKYQGGFSLIEVMVSSVLLAVGLLGNASLQTYVMRESVLKERRDVALMVSRKLVADAEAHMGSCTSFTPPVNCLPDKTCEVMLQEVGVTQAVKAVAATTLGSDTCAVEVSYSWADPNKGMATATHLHTMRLVIGGGAYVP